MPLEYSSNNEPRPKQCFATTCWSRVVAAGGGESDDARVALSELCQAYWQPLYAYVRGLGYSVADAQDLTQAFITRLLEKRTLEAADRERGKFRSFLLGSLDHFLCNEFDRASALKRGGGRIRSPWTLQRANHASSSNLHTT